MSFEMERIRHIGDMQDARWGAMSKQTFTTRVMPLFGAALGVTALGVYGGLQMLAAGFPMLALLLLAVVEIGLVFTAHIWQRKEGLNKVLFAVYALLAGVTMVPLLAFVGARGGLMLITQALTVTMITFGGLSIYGLVSKRDFSNLGGFLFIGGLALLATGLLNALVFHSGVLSLVASILSVGIFSAFTVYEMSMIRENYADEDYVGAALGLFIAFIGLFQSILQLFGLMGGNDD